MSAAGGDHYVARFGFGSWNFAPAVCQKLFSEVAVADARLGPVNFAGGFESAGDKGGAVVGVATRSVVVGHADGAGRLTFVAASDVDGALAGSGGARRSASVGGGVSGVARGGLVGSVGR